MKPSILLLPALAIFISCNNPLGGSHKAQPLTESAIYEIDSVRLALGGDREKEGSRRLGQAIDLYKNKKDAQGSVQVFKEAILINPSAKAYFELGNALLDNGSYSESIRALQVAEQLGYSPLANVMFKLAAAYAPHKGAQEEQNEARYQRDSLALHYMEVAIQMGFAHPDQFRTQEYFTQLKENYAFRKIYNAALAGGQGGKSPEKTLWTTFASEFPARLQLPLTINTAYIKDLKLDDPISYDYEKFIPEMRNAKFSREVENEYYYFATLKKNEAYTALMYAGKNNFLNDADGNSPVFFFIATYDGNGKIIDKMPVAGQADFTAPFKVLTIQPNFNFEVRDFHNVYKDDPQQVGYDSNHVIRSEPQGAAAYRIAANGKFEKTDAPLAMR
jgi:hypothetical protein